ncbi:MAG: GNAT family N-acetyltransferase [Eubacterium sp.]|nr:GNAT family N-acetyltransferase [Eubacterium sp.]
MLNNNIRLAEKGDIPALCELWKTCFNDTEDYIEYFYRENFERMSVVVYTIDGKPVSVVHLMEATFADKNATQKAEFIYATGTLPEYRKRGCMGALLEAVKEKAEQNGTAVFLKPSTPELARYYNKFGFESGGHFRLVTVTPEGAEPIDASPLSSEEYNKMRDEAFAEKPFAKWQDDHMLWCCLENDYFGGKTLAIKLDGETYFLMAAPEGDALVITETNLSLGQVKKLSGSLCRMFGTEKLRAYMADYSCNEGDKILSAVVYNTPLRDIYVNQILI